MAANEKTDGPSVPKTPEDFKQQYYSSNNNEEAEDLLRIVGYKSVLCFFCFLFVVNNF